MSDTTQNEEEQTVVRPADDIMIGGHRFHVVGTAEIILPSGPTPEAKEAEEPVEIDKTEWYIQNSDSLWFKVDQGEFVTLFDKTFQRAEDQWGEGVEYFQIVRDKLEPEELDRATKTAVAGKVEDITKIFVIGIKDSELTSEIKVGGRAFFVEDSTGGSGGVWSVSFIAIE
jgi:hypothetical protein